MDVVNAAMTVEAFHEHIGTGFVLTDPVGEKRLLTLIEAESLPRQDGSPAAAPFALLFRDASADVMPQGIYALAHDRWGSGEIFLAPIAKGPDGVDYSAIFN